MVEDLTADLAAATNELTRILVHQEFTGERGENARKPLIRVQYDDNIDEPEHGPGVAEAFRMLDTFASFDIIHTDIDKEKRGRCSVFSPAHAS